VDKKEAREYIKYAIANNFIMHPDRVRELYRMADYPIPPHLVVKELTDEEKEVMVSISKRLFSM
jgi:hypothetical protein